MGLPSLPDKERPTVVVESLVVKALENSNDIRVIPKFRVGEQLGDRHSGMIASDRLSNAHNSVVPSSNASDPRVRLSAILHYVDVVVQLMELDDRPVLQ